MIVARAAVTQKCFCTCHKFHDIESVGTYPATSSELFGVSRLDVIAAVFSCAQCAGAHAVALLDPKPAKPKVAKREKSEWKDDPTKYRGGGDTNTDVEDD